MKPNFALSLSFEGIRLLHRAPDGWRQVGEVAVDTPDGGQTRLRLYRPEEQVSETVILGTGPDAAGAVVDLFEELGVLP